MSLYCYRLSLFSGTCVVSGVFKTNVPVNYAVQAIKNRYRLTPLSYLLVAYCHRVVRHYWLPGVGLKWNWKKKTKTKPIAKKVRRPAPEKLLLLGKGLLQTATSFKGHGGGGIHQRHHPALRVLRASILLWETKEEWVYQWGEIMPVIKMICRRNKLQSFKKLF